jgi:PKD repeat protein
VTATNALGWQAAETVVTVEEPVGGLAAFNNSPTLLGLTTTLTATVASGTHLIYTWDLGDGTSATGARVEHIYPAAGVYTAVVTATNALGWEVVTTTVVVEQPAREYRYYLPVILGARPIDFMKWGSASANLGMNGVPRMPAPASSGTASPPASPPPPAAPAGARSALPPPQNVLAL